MSGPPVERAISAGGRCQSNVNALPLDSARSAINDAPDSWLGVIRSDALPFTVFMAKVWICGSGRPSTPRGSGQRFFGLVAQHAKLDTHGASAGIDIRTEARSVTDQLRTEHHPARSAEVSIGTRLDSLLGVRLVHRALRLTPESEPRQARAEIDGEPESPSASFLLELVPPCSLA